MKPHQAFFFRVRSVKQGDKITSALYGKIPASGGGVGVGGSFIGLGVKEGNVAVLSLTYYLNPTPNDRNLEWDMKKNLSSKPYIKSYLYEP
jgi:hypothetical protein